ncbi:hypothetical protein KC361_g275 [Hortaea werneckii]|nr:hypothetical protein KC361_g275 [Hortaea werneckii]
MFAFSSSKIAYTTCRKIDAMIYLVAAWTGNRRLVHDESNGLPRIPPMEIWPRNCNLSILLLGIDVGMAVSIPDTPSQRNELVGCTPQCREDPEVLHPYLEEHGEPFHDTLSVYSQYTTLVLRQPLVNISANIFIHQVTFKTGPDYEWHWQSFHDVSQGKLAQQRLHHVVCILLGNIIEVKKEERKRSGRILAAEVLETVNDTGAQDCLARSSRTVQPAEIRGLSLISLKLISLQVPFASIRGTQLEGLMQVRKRVWRCQPLLDRNKEVSCTAISEMSYQRPKCMRTVALRKPFATLLAVRSWASGSMAWLYYLYVFLANYLELNALLCFFEDLSKKRKLTGDMGESRRKLTGFDTILLNDARYSAHDGELQPT